MARKQIIGVGLLSDKRAVRVAKITAPLMREMSIRTSKRFPAEAKPTNVEIADALDETMIALCVKGITPGPVKTVMRKRPPTDVELEKAKKEKQPAPTEVEEVDVDATLAPYVNPASPEFKTWILLGEMQLADKSDDNPLSMDALFEEPSAWRSVLGQINAHAGGQADNPFVGKLVRTSST